MDKKLNIAFMIDGFPVVSETFILNQITGLIDKGHRIMIFPRYRSDQVVVNPEILKYRLEDRVIYPDKIMPQSWWKKIVAVFGMVFKRGFQCPLSVMKSLNFFKYGRNAFNFKYLLYVLHFREFDVVHCHYGTNGCDYVFLKELIGKKVQFITTFHAYELTRNQFIRNGSYNRLFSLGDIFLPISRNWENKLVEMGCPGTRIDVHHMGIDLGKYNFRVNAIKDKIKLLGVGRLVEKKGFIYAIRAVAKLAKDYSNLEYNIIGDGPLGAELQQEINRLNAQNNIVLLGSKPSNQVYEYLKDSHIFILTSVTAQDGNQEGIPVSLMEAMAVGLPVVSTDHSGISELISDKQSGFLAQERDSEGIYNILKYLIENQGAWKNICESARKTIENQFEIGKLNDLLEKKFYSAVGGGS